MTDKEKKERVQLLADTIQMLLGQVDIFTMGMTTEDLELLEEARSKITEKINHNESAIVLITALGGNYDSTEDRMKRDTLDLIINLMKTRLNYKEGMLEQKRQEIRNKEILKTMGIQ